MAWVRTVAALAVLAAALAAEARDRATAGLLWNRTGRPAVFPLQIKPPAGADVHVLLTEAGTGREALAAVVPGGGPFRLLVPEGRYMAGFSRGDGPDARRVTVGPLSFRVGGAGRKEGHLVVLTDRAPEGLGAEVRGFALCRVAMPSAGVRAPAPARPPRERPPPPLPGEPRIANGPPVLTRDGPPDLLRGPDAARWGPLAPPAVARRQGGGRDARETPCD